MIRDHVLENSYYRVILFKAREKGTCEVDHVDTRDVDDREIGASSVSGACGNGGCEIFFFGLVGRRG